jgi:hypothetical protein
MTKRLVLLLLALGAPGMGLSAQSAAQEGTPPYTPVTLCGISIRHQKVKPKYVSLDAEYVNATPHGLFLIDRHCRGKGLQIDFPKTGLDPGAATLKDNLWIIAQATGTFRGMLERDQRTGRLCLIVQSVLGFRPKYFDPERKDKPLRLPDPELPR